MSQRDAIHVVFAGGGTGGHLFPGLAVARRLCEEIPGVRVTFAGSGRKFEREHVTAAGFEYLALRSHPLSRRSWRLGAFLADNLAGYVAARRFLKREHVAAVVGLGGFASVPMARAAVGRRVPLVLLEQNAVPGRANRWLARWAEVVCLAFAQSQSHFRRGSRVEVTGNPIRAEFLCRVAAATRLPLDFGTIGATIASGGRESFSAGDLRPGQAALAEKDSRPRGRSRKRLIVLGGSGGAGALNENVPRALARLGSRLAGWSVLHQSGEAEFHTTRRLYQRLGVPTTVVPFVADMPGALAGTDLAVCRAGGTTLAELAATGVPAVLLPYPHAADDHQRRNAEAYAEAGGCLMLDEREPAGPPDVRLAETLRPLLASARLRKAMSRSMHRLARPRATDDVAGRIRRLIG